jgi:hypothetical protein
MNKASLSKNHALSLVIFIFMLCALICLMPVQVAEADAAPPPDPTVGGMSPYQPQKTNVQMMSETVFIDVPASPSDINELKRIKVKASFIMRNQGQTREQMQVIFPLSRLGHDGSSEQALYKVLMSSFIVKVNGRLVPITELTTPPEVSGFDVPDVLWAAFEVTFPVNKDVLLQVEYEMVNEYGEYGEGFTGIAYILETGAGWYGNILSADITLRLPYPVTEEAIRWANPGYTISGKKLHWELRNFEPTRGDNLEVGVVHVDIWQKILELRSRVEQHPKDADAWAELGDLYTGQGLYTREWFIVWSDPHFTQLAIEARQKAVTLRPEWGDAHCKFGEILWLGNPNVQNTFRQGGVSTAPDLHLDDPAIQQVIYELQQAWIYGTDECIDSDLYRYIKMAFPALELTPPVTPTITRVLPAETSTLTATNTTLPTASSTSAFEPTVTLTLTPIISPTPISAPDSSATLYTGLIILTVGLVILIGTFIYQRKSSGGGPYERQR